jgi:Glyoxalase/Bleomycin resistance protein/Dioxygenase superfamily
MSEQGESGAMSSPFARPIAQLGFVIPDLEQEIQSWLEKGVGPWFTLGGAMPSDYVYQGNKSSPRFDSAFSYVGPVQLELLQPMNDEPSVFGDFVKAGGNGLHRFGWSSEDLKSDRAVIEAGSGQRVLQTGSVLGTPFVYYTMKEPIGSPLSLVGFGKASGEGLAAASKVAASWNGEITELFEPNKMSQRTFKKVSEAVENWDGKSDPVRHLLSPVMQGAFELQTFAQRVGRWFRER